MFKKFITVFSLFVAATGAQALSFSDCKNFFPSGVAPVVQASKPGNQRELCFSSFAVLHSGQSKTPVFVAERLTKAQLLDAADEERTNKFYPEARLPSADRAQLDDYARSGFDRGHMAPAGDMPNPESMAQSFSLANMVPQTPELNRGPWAKSVEIPTRQYVKNRAKGAVYVFTGPLYSANPSKIGPGKVWVPSHTYKLVYDEQANRAWGFILENSNSPRMTPPVSYADIVKATGIEFLPGKNPSK